MRRIRGRVGATSERVLIAGMFLALAGLGAADVVAACGLSHVDQAADSSDAVPAAPYPTTISQLPDDGTPRSNYYHQADRLCGMLGYTPMRKPGADPAKFGLDSDEYACGPLDVTGDWYLWSFVHAGRMCSLTWSTDAECRAEIARADQHFVDEDAAVVASQSPAPK